jgi:hypothetical protein
VQVIVRASQICSAGPERNVTIRTHQVLTGVLDAESGQRLTIVINKRCLGVLTGQVSDHQEARESMLKHDQAILPPCGDRAAEQ